MEKTLVFIKPDGVEKGIIGEILSRFEKRGLRFAELKLMNLTEELVMKHYEEHVDRPFFPGLKEYVMSGPVVVAVVEGPSAISVVRTMCGATNPAESAPGTIRGDFGLTLDANVIHSSDSEASANREISNFFG
jgi:nucleoside-diphosphate kinase